MISQLIDSLAQKLATARLGLLQHVKILEDKAANVAEIAKVYKDFDADLNTLATSIDEDLHVVNNLLTGIERPATNGTVVGVKQAASGGYAGYVVTPGTLMDQVREVIPQHFKRNPAIHERKDLLAMLLKVIPGQKKSNSDYLDQCLAGVLREQRKQNLLRRVAKGQYQAVATPSANGHSNGHANNDNNNNGSGLGGKGVKRDPSSYIAVIAGEMPSLRTCILRVFGPPSARRHFKDYDEVMQKVKEMGYKSTAKDFKNVVCSMMNKMREVELDTDVRGWYRIR